MFISKKKLYLAEVSITGIPDTEWYVKLKFLEENVPIIFVNTS